MGGKESLRQKISSLKTTSPVRMLVVLMFSAFLAELAIMAALSLFPPIPYWIENFLDASILTTFLFPALYYWVFRPLTQLIERQKLTEAELLKYRDHLEHLVESRTVELQKAEERYRKLFEETSDAIAFADAETGVFLDINQSFADLLGWERAELIGKPQRVVHPNVDETAVSSSFERRRSDRFGKVIETQAITKDGEILEVSIKASVIELNGQKVLLRSFRDITARKLAEKKLAASYSLLQQLALHLDIVREEERGRIAREIHDEMGATLTALKMRIHWLASKLPPEMTQFTAETEQMDKLVADTIHTMRHAVRQLKPTLLHDLGFTPAVKHYVQDFQKNTGIECGLVLPEEGLTLDENQSSAMFRILQESLNNVAKHAQATRVSILFINRNHSLILIVRDDGVGFDRNTHKNDSFGLVGINERALMVSGKARISSKPGKGTQVLVIIPLVSIRKSGIVAR